jgi:hypothetical protein
LEGEGFKAAVWEKKNLKLAWGLGIFEMEAPSSYFLGLKDDGYFWKS